MASLDAKVLGLFDKLQALQSGAASPPTPVPSPPACLQIALTQSEPSALSELEEARKKIRLLEEDSIRSIAALRVQIDAEQKMVTSEFERWFDILPDALPAAKVPEPEHLRATGALYSTLQTWATSGAAIPFDWEALPPITGEELNILVVAKELLGSTWKHWYPQEEPSLKGVAPRQVAMLLLHCLNEIKSNFKSNDKDQHMAAAKQGMDSMRSGAKRLRAA